MQPTDITYFADANAFRQWLSECHVTHDELWVGFWKKATGRPSITWPESVDEALCFGWIDGIRKKVDDEAYTIRFTPRRPGSIWSRRNAERFEVLLAEGRIETSGQAARGKRTQDKSGIYSYEQDAPQELSSAYLTRLQDRPVAWEDWESRPPGYKRQVAHWVMSAKRESTRERRLAALIEDCAAGRKIKPLRY